MRSMPGIAVLLCAAGCTSYGALNSPITDDNAVLRPDLVGSWKTEQPFDDSSLLIEVAEWPYGGYEYDVTMRDSTEVVAEMEARVAEFGSTLIVAALPGENEYRGTVLPLYQFYRLRPSGGDTLFIDVLEPEALRELLGRDGDIPAATNLERDPDILFLATSSELAEVFTFHAVEDDLWSSQGNASVFVRVP